MRKKKLITIFLIKENSSLKEKMVNLAKFVYKFTQGKKSFDLMFGEQNVF